MQLEMSFYASVLACKQVLSSESQYNVRGSRRRIDDADQQQQSRTTQSVEFEVGPSSSGENVAALV